MLHSVIDLFFSSLIITLAFLKPLTEKVKIHHYGFLFSILFLAEIFQKKIDFSAFFIIGIAFLYMFILTKNKLLNAILGLFGYFTVVVSNNLLLLFLQKAFHISVTTINTSYIVGVSFYTCFLALVFLLTGLIGRYAKKRLRPADFNRYQKLFSLVFTEVLLATAVLIFNIDYGNYLDYPNSTIIYNCILFFLYFVLSTLLLINIVQTTKKNMEAEQKEIEYNQLLEYMRDLEKTSLTLRKFRHDYLNTLLSLDLMIHTRDIDSLIPYFDTYIKPEGSKISGINMDFAGLGHIEDPAVKGIVSHKLQMAHLRNILVKLEILEDVHELNMDPYDLTRILGFFLDNAIEAASEDLSEPYIYAAFIPTEQNLTIIIENTCPPEDIPMERLTEEGFSTKGRNRGHGLHQVEEILSGYPYVKHSMQKKENLFSQTLELYPNPKA